MDKGEYTCVKAYIAVDEGGIFVCFREMTERLNHLQRDIEHVRENLSSGQYSIDPNFLLGVGLMQHT